MLLTGYKRLIIKKKKEVKRKANLGWGERRLTIAVFLRTVEQKNRGSRRKVLKKRTRSQLKFPRRGGKGFPVKRKEGQWPLPGEDHENQCGELKVTGVFGPNISRGNRGGGENGRAADSTKGEKRASKIWKSRVLTINISTPRRPRREKEGGSPRRGQN